MKFWPRIRDALRAFGKRGASLLRKREAAPGRFEFGSASSWRGYVATAPLVEPSRDYLVYVPRGWS